MNGLQWRAENFCAQTNTRKGIVSEHAHAHAQRALHSRTTDERNGKRESNEKVHTRTLAAAHAARTETVEMHAYY